MSTIRKSTNVRRIIKSSRNSLQTSWVCFHHRKLHQYRSISSKTSFGQQTTITKQTIQTPYAKMITRPVVEMLSRNRQVFTSLQSTLNFMHTNNFKQVCREVRTSTTSYDNDQEHAGLRSRCRGPILLRPSTQPIPDSWN